MAVGVHAPAVRGQDRRRRRSGTARPGRCRSVSRSSADHSAVAAERRSTRRSPRAARAAASSASRSSTIASTSPPPPRTIRPKSAPIVSVRSIVSSVAAAPALAVRPDQRQQGRRVDQRVVGVHDQHVAVEAGQRLAAGQDGVAGAARAVLHGGRRPVRARARRARADRAATITTAGSAASGSTARQRPARAAGGRRRCAAPWAGATSCACPCRRRGRGRRAVAVMSTQKGRLGRLDSNQGSRDQNPLPYHLATPHRRAVRQPLRV